MNTIFLYEQTHMIVEIDGDNLVMCIVSPDMTTHTGSIPPNKVRDFIAKFSPMMCWTSKVSDMLDYCVKHNIKIPTVGSSWILFESAGIQDFFNKKFDSVTDFVFEESTWIVKLINVSEKLMKSEDNSVITK